MSEASLFIFGLCFIVSFIFLIKTIQAISQKKRILINVTLFILPIIIFITYAIISNRPSYKIVKFTEEERAEVLERQRKAVSSYKPGKYENMSEDDKRIIFYRLVVLQDKYMKKYPYDNQKQQDAYEEIAKRENVSESTVRKIAVEGARKRWPPIGKD